MKIAKIKRKLKNKRWVQWQIDKTMIALVKIHKFLTYKGNAIFVGDYLAAENRAWGYRERQRLESRCTFLKKIRRELK